MQKEAIIDKSKKWVERFVIGLKLCPFAKKPYDKNQVRFEVCLDSKTEAQLIAFWREVELLINTPKEKISNTILIYPCTYATHLHTTRAHARMITAGAATPRAP